MQQTNDRASAPKQNVVSLDEFREHKRGAWPEASPADLGLDEIRKADGSTRFIDVPFEAVANLLGYILKHRHASMCSFYAEFDDQEVGRIKAIDIPAVPDKDLLWSMPFDFCTPQAIPEYLKAYHWMVAMDREPRSVIVSAHVDNWLAFESTAETHDKLPTEAFEATK